MSESHLAAGLALSSAARWPHRLDDWKQLLSVSTGIVALMETRIVGTALRSDFGTRLSALNMVLVAEDMRGKGIGGNLVSALMDKPDGHAYRLVATLSGRPLYEKFGFDTVGAIEQFQGKLADVPVLKGAEEASWEDCSEIINLDSHAFGGDRSLLIASLLEAGRIAVVRENGCITAFAGLRRFGFGKMVGPIISPGTDATKVLISHLINDLTGQFVRLDILETSGISVWLEALGLQKVATAPIMQRGRVPISASLQALHSQALG